MRLPSPQAFLTDLFNSLAPAEGLVGVEKLGVTATAPPPTNNPLHSLPPGSSVRNLLLTLHVVFPHELLPALDLLDRRLVTRFRSPSPTPSPAAALYYVRSAQQKPNRHRRGVSVDVDSDGVDATTVNHWYEVRLMAWNCSCPAFAFSAFPAGEVSAAGGAEESADQHVAARQCSSAASADELTVWNAFGFGGLRQNGPGSCGRLPPVCKHLMACLLLERAPSLFEACVEEKVVGVDEAAAWAAGIEMVPCESNSIHTKRVDC